MVRTVVFLLLSVLSISAVAQSGVLSREAQIHAALLAAPADKRDKATVYGFSEQKELIVLREGSNEMYCIADDPSNPGFSVSCYHSDLHPFMQRGRDLRKTGKSQDEIFKTREKE